MPRLLQKWAGARGRPEHPAPPPRSRRGWPAPLALRHVPRCHIPAKCMGPGTRQPGFKLSPATERPRDPARDPSGPQFPIRKMAVAGLRTAHDSEDLCGGRQTHAQLPRLAPGSPAAARMGAVTSGPNAAVALTCLRRCHMTERERNGYPRASAGWDGPTAALPAGGANRFLPVPAR